jgi:cation diffusion facilitator CzcD-associated flavoprotein CzcO
MPLLDETDYVPTEKYARAKELLKHAEMIGRRYGLYERTYFQTEVKALRWDETSARWTAETNRGDKIRGSFVIPASGPLHRPKLPGLKGIESYKGHSFHSSRWDYDYTGGDPTGGLEKLKDKRVGIIGTGATAVQIVPHLGQWAKETVVFQRTPSSIDVRGNKFTEAKWVQTLGKGWQKKRMDNFNASYNNAVCILR